MKKKMILATSLVAAMFMVTACSGKNVDDKETETELLTKPEITQSATENASSESSTEDVGELINGYQKILYGEDEIYFPYIKESEQVRGVQYLYDAYFLLQDRKSVV